MKQILSMNIALIGVDTIEHPTMIFTDDEVDVNIFSDKEALITFIAGMGVDKFPTIPEVGEPCMKGKTYAYGTDKAKCLQEHTRMHYAPEETPALWLIIPTVTAGYPEWKQPAGGHDAYAIGDRVSFNGNNYESVINANVWSPVIYPAGWKQI